MDFVLLWTEAGTTWWVIEFDVVLKQEVIAGSVDSDRASDRQVPRQSE